MSAVLDFPVKPEARDYLARFARDAAEPGWLASRRQQGMTRFAELGFPSRKSEAWRYLDLRGLAERPLLPARASAIAAPHLRQRLAALSPDHAGSRLVLIDGRFVPDLSHIEPRDGVWLGPAAQAMRERSELMRAAIEGTARDAGQSFAELNTAFFADGFVLDVAAGVVLERPVEIVHLASGADEASFHTRSVVRLGEGSRAEIVETYAGEGRYWRNDRLGVALEDGAELIHTALVEEAAEAVHLAQLDGAVGAGARFAGFILLLDGGRTRREANMRLGDGAQCRIDGAYIVAGNDEANIVTNIDHAAPGGTSSELIKGVAAGRGHGAFQGRIVVRQHAQRTDARQLSRNLLLGRRAAIDTKPELEILADDVKCSHGASVGDLDEAALFYLRARGIPEADARRMLIEGFLREPVEAIPDAAVREHLLRRLAARLAVLED